MNPEEFSRRVLAWFDRHGRKDLPWKSDPSPYRVWVSEIMLQQTQVNTVIPYYRRFVIRFPDVIALADAELDEVLHLWSGLGYYARARNLHRAATIVRDRYGGELPENVEALRALPGIGRSTAGAILALARNERQPILDGNVKRVLARFAAVEGWPGQGRALDDLWTLAERYTPHERVSDYTQAMMDLGAMICVRRPHCRICPVAAGCAAHAQGRETAYPAPRPRRERPVRRTRLLLLQTPKGEVLLEKRPPTGVWGGLWSLPECTPETDVASWCRDRLGVEVGALQPWTELRHTFSHFHLDITPVRVAVRATPAVVMEAERHVWYNVAQPDERGLAAPVRRLLAMLANDF